MAKTAFTLNLIIPEPNNYLQLNILLLMHHNDRDLEGQ